MTDRPATRSDWRPVRRRRRLRQLTRSRLGRTQAEHIGGQKLYPIQYRCLPYYQSRRFVAQAYLSWSTRFWPTGPSSRSAPPRCRTMSSVCANSARYSTHHDRDCCLLGGEEATPLAHTRHLCRRPACGLRTASDELHWQLPDRRHVRRRRRRHRLRALSNDDFPVCPSMYRAFSLESDALARTTALSGARLPRPPQRERCRGGSTTRARPRRVDCRAANWR